MKLFRAQLFNFCRSRLDTIKSYSMKVDLLFFFCNTISIIKSSSIEKLETVSELYKELFDIRI